MEKQLKNFCKNHLTLLLLRVKLQYIKAIKHRVRKVCSEW